MFKVVFYILLFVYTLNSQFVDPYGIYSNYTVNFPGFYKATICNCDNNLTISSNDFLNYTEVIIGNYYNYKESEITVKINLTNINILNLFTDYVNIIKYTVDGNTWSNYYKGQFYACNIKGFMLMNIKSTIGSIIRFYTMNISNCITSGNKDTIVRTKIIGDSFLEYNFNAFGIGLFITSSTSSCEFDTYMFYNGTGVVPGSIKNKYNYSIGSSFAQEIITSGTYNIYLYIIPVNKTVQCDLVIHLTDLIYSAQYTSPVLFYNNTQIINYLLLNQTYDPTWTGIVTLDGGTSVNSAGYAIQNLNNSMVYSIFKQYGLINNITYFQPLLISYGDYIGTNLTINNNFNFTQDLIVNMSTVDINISMIPINMTFQDANIFIYKNTSIQGINFQGNNTLTGNSTINVPGNVIFSGMLILDVKNTSGTHTLISYNSSNGNFSQIITADKCTDVTPKYLSSELSVTFSIKKQCQNPSPAAESDGIIYYVVIPIVVILVIICVVIVVLIIKVPSIRRRVFPYRDRAVYIRNKKSNIENQPTIEDYRETSGYKPNINVRSTDK